jgi:hypothetical protein
MRILIETKKPEEMASGLEWIRQNLSGEFEKKSDNIIKSDDIKDKGKAMKAIEILKGKLFLTWSKKSDYRFEVLISYSGENFATNWQIKKSFMETFKQIDAELKEI